MEKYVEILGEPYSRCNMLIIRSSFGEGALTPFVAQSFYRIFMVVRHKVLWTYVQRVYGRTALGGKDVRAEGAWTYVQRCFERA